MIIMKKAILEANNIAFEVLKDIEKNIEWLNSSGVVYVPMEYFYEKVLNLTADVFIMAYNAGKQDSKQ